MSASVLILCTGNSARSQMAEGLLRALDPALEIHSAGTRPAGQVHPGAIEAMREAGIDISGHTPKSVEAFLDRPFDFVITVCDHANETCPVFSGKVRRRLHIGFEDPAAVAPGEQAATFRRVRDEIRERLGGFYRAEIAGFRPAAPADLPAVEKLLAACSLPVEGVADQFGESYVVRQTDAGVIGAAGVEVHGESGLLRSVAVMPSERGAGLGARLVRDRLEWARSRGLAAVYLLTTDAAPYFERLGFETVRRDVAPDGIRASRQFAGGCCAGAAFMRLAF